MTKKIMILLMVIGCIFIYCTEILILAFIGAILVTISFIYLMLYSKR
jgi:hypothetical protein